MWGAASEKADQETMARSVPPRPGVHVEMLRRDPLGHAVNVPLRLITVADFAAEIPDGREVQVPRSATTPAWSEAQTPPDAVTDEGDGADVATAGRPGVPTNT